MRLNQFIAHAGVCSRRKADTLIAEGQIEINGHIVRAVGQRVTPTDRVVYQGRKLAVEQQVYILFNKPTNCVTTLSDPHNRKRVIDYLPLDELPRIYPVGRLDYKTVGLLLLTNDGSLARLLSHPSSQVSKAYEITLQEPMSPSAIAQISQGVHLSDGFARFDSLELLDKELLRFRVTLHSGKNRIVRRIFGSQGHGIALLERTGYAHLVRGDLALGDYRFLNHKEVQQLQGASRVAVKNQTRVIR